MTVCQGLAPSSLSIKCLSPQLGTCWPYPATTRMRSRFTISLKWYVIEEDHGLREQYQTSLTAL
jgi:hypothetical protein